MNPSDQQKITRKKQIYGYLYIFLVVLILGFTIFYLPFFGFSFPPCGVREKEADIPLYQNKSFKFTKTISSLSGTNANPVRCRPFSSQTDKSIIPASPLDKTINIAQDELFTIQSSYLTRQVGLHGIDNGTRWNRYFILTDRNGNKYKESCLGLTLYSELIDLKSYSYCD
jgi:hypothetical protein